VHNAYPRDAKNGWRLPSVAVGSEAWAAVSMPMEKLAQARRSNAEIALRIEYTFTDSDGESRQRTAAWDLSAMPLLNDAAYDALPAEELVVRRFSELQVADILQQARAAVIERDWKTVEALLAEVRKQSQSNAWLEAVVTQLEKMLKERDGARMAKEMHFGAARMHNRLAFSRELDDIDLAKAPLHLRRRDLQGRRDEK
jgi:Ca-activated chloride channel family protein